MKGNYENYILYGILALVIIGLIFSFSGFFSGSSGNKLSANPNVAATTAAGTGLISFPLYSKVVISFKLNWLRSTECVFAAMLTLSLLMTAF